VNNDWRYWKDFEPSAPIPVQGGIRSHSRQGGFAQSWWAKRWIAALESFDLGGRLQRGRSYARRGQVMDIQIGKGAAHARVQGSRPTPYEVSVKVTPLSAENWQKVADAVSGSAVFVAKLLGGEMPQEIESAFRGAGVSLFPERRKDLVTYCSCPDSVNPCKHVAAVYYLLGEEFDRDPFLIFQLRGMMRDEFLSLLGAATAAAPEQEQEPPEPLDTKSFWSGSAVPDHLTAPAPPSSKAALPRRLGKFPFWRGRYDLITTLANIYNNASEKAVQQLSAPLQPSPGGDHPSN
jgi:uncharacterized Zn finger protein